LHFRVIRIGTKSGVIRTMRIDFECSGGYVPLHLTYHADTDDLPQVLAEELLELVESSGVFDLQPSEVAPTSTGPPDVILYQLSVSDGGRKTSLSVNDVTAPAELRPLLGRLRQLALEQRRTST
jgi:hypothetical protein